MRGIIQNESGMSLVEVMVAGTVMLGMSYAMTSMVVNSQKASKTGQAMGSHSLLVSEIQRSLSSSALCKAAFNLPAVGDSSSVIATKFAGQPGHNSAITLYHPSGAAFLSSGGIYDQLNIKTLNLQIASTPVATGSSLYAATLTVTTEVPMISAPVSVLQNTVSVKDGGVSNETNLQNVLTPTPTSTPTSTPTAEPSAPQATSFGLRERTAQFNLTLVRNATLGTSPAGRFDNCYNVDSVEQMSQTFCETSMDGVWNPNTGKCSLNDVKLSGIPLPSVKGSICQLRPDQCPTGVYQEYTLLNAPGGSKSYAVGGGRSFSIPTVSSPSIVDPIIDQIEMKVHYCEGSWRGFFGLTLDGQNITNTGEWTGIRNWDNVVSVTPSPPNYSCQFGYQYVSGDGNCGAIRFVFSQCQIRGKTLNLTWGKESNEVYPYYIKVRTRRFDTTF